MEKTKDVSKKVVAPKAETEKKSLKVAIPELTTFLKAGAHFGHKGSAWNPKMKKYIYEVRNGIHIIDIIKSRKMLTKALEELNQVVDKGNILIVGTKGQAAGTIEKMAKEVGAFYITKRWPGGLFTNFDAIKGTIQKLERLNKVYEVIKFMDELPKFLIVIDSKVEKNSINEARIAEVPIIALVDTNCDPDLVTFPIPANDDSIKSIELFVDLFSQVIKSGKKSESLASLRKNHEANLKNLKNRFVEEKERQEKMEEGDRLRMKAMREGKVQVATTGVVRVVKKEKNLEEEYAAAEAVKAQVNSKKIEELGLPTRIEKSLKEAGLSTVDDLAGKTKEELLSVKGVGEKAVEDILKAIK